MESVVIDSTFWRDKPVFLTGHTGFKGAWLALWLQRMGARVTGLALAPETGLSLYQVARVGERMDSQIGNINDLTALTRAVQHAEPEIVFHLAAQSLVRRSYDDPISTYQTNVMGSLNLLEAIRSCPTVKAVVMVTTDKCYDNREWHWPYRESDCLGGYDPYSSSKACMELLVASYRNSFFAQGAAAVATARAGNVLGGGDWAEDRLLPDLIRALDSKQAIVVRNPRAIRPWQHVLEPLAGYLRLAECLYRLGHDYAEAWNFGPDSTSCRSVGWLIEQVAERWPTLSKQIDSGIQPHEAHFLTLDSSKAKARLGWHSRWDLSKALEKTLDWYEQHKSGTDMKNLCWAQIDHYNQTGHEA